MMALPPVPRMMSTGQISSGLLCSTSTTSPMERLGAEIAYEPYQHGGYGSGIGPAGILQHGVPPNTELLQAGGGSH
jgi:hypothetical protein